jgi:NAD+ synthetase
MLASIARQHKVPVALVNQVGGNDGLVFDGSSLVLNPEGQVIAQGRSFEEDLIFFDSQTLSGETHEQMAGDEASVYSALVLGTRDYVRKNRFRQVVVGLSGGVDSSLVAAIAADALGPEAVTGVTMPSRFTSDESRRYAAALVQSLGIRTLDLPIEPAAGAYEATLAAAFAGKARNEAEENIQARIRGTLLMALSNKFGSLVLTTGNKSEMSVGYATLYGDMAGGFAVIKDVPKTLVYRLARWRNERAGHDLIPAGVIERAPTAELREQQTDQDTLPPYEVLDPILRLYVEDDRSAEEIVAQGFDPATVARVVRMVDASEYKRRQAPPGIKITPKAFGRDRRLPITNWYRGRRTAEAPTGPPRT